METPQITRREAIQWVLAAGATFALSPYSGFAADGAAPVTGKPYGTDAVLNKTYSPGDLWPLTLSGEQKKTVSALCDLIIPEDDKSPAASQVGVPAFIDEWISAPYPEQSSDRDVVLKGLAWIDTESGKRFGKPFAELSVEDQTQIADDIHHAPDAKPEFKEAAGFFATFRNLTASGFYTTPVGMKDVGFIGNVPLQRFAGPPKAILEKFGLTEA
jgi:hypothetical protein